MSLELGIDQGHDEGALPLVVVGSLHLLLVDRNGPGVLRQRLMARLHDQWKSWVVVEPVLDYLGLDIE